MKLFNYNNCTLGIDIGSRNIKAVKIKKAMKSFKILQIANVPIPAGAVKQGLLSDSNLALSLMREVVNQVKGSGLAAYLAFSGQNAIVREIEMPVMAERDLAEAIRWEAEKVLSYPVDEAIMDWIVLERGRDIDQMMSILVVAARKDYIRSFLKPVKSVGIKPLNLSIFPLPLINILKFVPEFSTYTTSAVIDMGAEATHVLIIKEGLPRLSRTIPTGGNDFTEAVVNGFSLPFEEAEKIKIGHGTLEAQEININQLDLMANPYFGIGEYLNNVAQDVLSEIKRSFVHFQLHNRGQQIEVVYLTGGTSLLPGVAVHLQKFLNVSVIQLDLMRYFEVEKSLKDRFAQESAFMAEALGLALSEV